MAFDDTKTTEDGDGTVDSDEQVSADEWNAMVADQKSRVLFGTLAERPAAGDVPNGTPYLVTDLANNGGVITKVVSGSWQIQQIGDETNRPDIVGGSGDFESVITEILGNIYYFAGDHDGADPISRLDNAISGSPDGSAIFLEPVEYGSLTLTSTREYRSPITGLNASSGIAEGETWTVNNDAMLRGLDISGTLEINENSCRVRDITLRSNASLVINANDVTVVGVMGGGSVTFASGTSGGELVATASTLTVTDNGSNGT
jgi:hypothetical protein